MIDPRLVKNLLPIEGDLVKLIVFTEKNISDTYLSWLNDPDVVRFSNQRFRRHTRETSLEYLQELVAAEGIFCAVCLKGDGKYVGTMTVRFSVAHERAEIGIMIGNKKVWGKGIGGDAWSTLMSFLLNTVKIRKVFAGTLRCNKGMVKIMMKSGMISDGVLVTHELVDGKEEDIVFFSKFRKC